METTLLRQLSCLVHINQPKVILILGVNNHKEVGQWMPSPMLVGRLQAGP